MRSLPTFLVPVVSASLVAVLLVDPTAVVASPSPSDSLVPVTAGDTMTARVHYAKGHKAARRVQVMAPGDTTVLATPGAHIEFEGEGDEPESRPQVADGLAPDPHAADSLRTPAARERAVAAALAAVEADSLGENWVDWRREHPTTFLKTRADKEEGMSDFKDAWVYRAVEPFAGGIMERTFYMLEEDSLPSLERVTWSAGSRAGLAPRQLGRVFRAILRAMRDAHGALDSSRSVPAPEDFMFMEGWGGQRIVASPRNVLRAYRSNGQGDSVTDAVVLERVSWRLLQILRDGDRDEWPSREFASGDSANDFDDVVIAATKGRWPELFRMIRKPGPLGRELPKIERLFRETRAPRLSRGARDLLSLALAQWAIRTPSRARDTLGFNAVRRTLRSEGVESSYSEAGGWCFDPESLFAPVLADAGTNRWADGAFLQRQREGWRSPCALCGYDSLFGPDYFRPTIQRGNAFLRRFPHNAIAGDVLLTVAEAHETAWSLSKVGGNEMVDGSRYRPDAEAHRLRAIELYERCLRGVPDVPWARRIRHRLARIRLDIDTGYQEYWCLWD